MNAMYRMADLYVLPSYYEGFSAHDLGGDGQ